MDFFPLNSITDAASQQQAQAAGAGGSGALTDSVMGRDEFLKLLVTQLSNQDPMNPSDGKEFAAQLAQFSTVERLINIEDTLKTNGDSNGLLAQSINSGVAAGLIGKTIESSGNGFNLGEKGEVPLDFELADAADSVTVTIKDETGAVVRTMDLDGMDKGKHSVDWDGTSGEGDRLSAGRYTFEVQATADDEPVGVQTYFRGVVDRVTFGQDGIKLWIGDVSVAMSNVSSVAETVDE